MGNNIAELNTGGVIVRTIAAGTRMGFDKPTPSFAISTADRSAERDYIVLTRAEAVKVAIAILKDDLNLYCERYGTVTAKKYLSAIADLMSVDMDKLIEM